MNMKRRYLILTFAAIAALMSSCGKEEFDDSKIWDAIEELKNRVTALEEKVNDNVAAIQSMVSLGSVASWEYDAQSGKGVITLVDGKKITIDQSTKGYSLVTVTKGEDGVYYWAICKDGVAEPLLIDGKKVPVAVIPDLKISENKEWMISVDGGKTWVGTGIMYEGTSPDQPEPVVEFFQDVHVDGEYLMITLADGTELKVAVVGEASFTAASDTLWFSRGGMEKAVAVEMVSVKAYTVTEKPEGWKARMDDGYLYVTSPADFNEAPRQGTVKVLAVFEAMQTPAILSVEVVHESMFTLSYVNGKISVVLSEHTGEDFNGYVLTGWRKNGYSVDGALEWYNAQAGSLVPFEGTAEYEMSDIIADYDVSQDYVVTAVPYLPAMQVSQGRMKYSADDLLQVNVKSSGSAWSFSNIRFDNADFTAEMDGPFYGGFFRLEDWNNYGRDNFLETLELGEVEPYEIPSYYGPANGFPDGVVNIGMKPVTDYVVWYVPVNEAGTYTQDDFITYTFTTTDVSSDSSVAAPTFVTKDATVAGFTADITPATGTYRTYAAILKAAAIPEDEQELVRYLVSLGMYSDGAAVNTVSNYSLSADDEVYVVAVSLTEDGGYGQIVKENVAVKDLTFTDALGVEVSDVTYGQGDVTLSLTFKGNPLNITYFAATYTYYTDDVLERLMALGQYGDAARKEVSKLDGKIYLDGLTLGAEHTFYAVVTDADGNASRLYKYVFTPKNDVYYIISGKEGYEYGMPQLSGTCLGSSTYTLTLNVDMPATCRKYWLFKGNYEYFTGDPWTDSDKLVTLQYSDVTVHTESVSGLKYSYMNSTSRIYMVWLDDKGDYHAIYEYNPKKK